MSSACLKLMIYLDGFTMTKAISLKSEELISERTSYGTGLGRPYFRWKISCDSFLTPSLLHTSFGL